MNKDKVIKDLKERNDSLKNQLMLLQAREFNLNYENKQLKENIDKAIEYIKPKFVEQGGFTSYEWNDLINDLLEILGDSE